MNQESRPKPNYAMRGILVLVGMTMLGVVAYRNQDNLARFWPGKLTLSHEDSPSNSSRQSIKRPLFELVRGKTDTLRLTGRDLASLNINVFTISDQPPPSRLRLPGVLTLDPNRFIRVHSRFPGEVRRVGTAAGKNRPLQYGDAVVAGQLLATIWSKDIGEKKSELVDALTREHFDRIILERLKSVEESVVTKRAINDADRNYQADKVAVSKAERTLRSWNLTQKEIDAVRQEAEDFVHQRESIGDDGHWAELDVLAAQSGVIMLKNFNVGDIVDTTTDLMMISDLDRLQVLANVFEEDLPVLRQLEPGERKWTLQLKADSQDTAVTGEFDQISIIVDPKMHTSTVMGYVDNSKRLYAIGQFITATIEIPGDPGQIVIPISAAIEDGNSTSIFVETNAERQEFSRRKIAVVKRGMTMMHVAIAPDKLQAQRGAQGLHPGERILINSVVELDAELDDLISSAPKQ